MAEGVFRGLATSHPRIGEIDSAGTGAYHALEPPDPRTMAALRNHGITNYTHAARKVTEEDFFNFDYLLAMDKYNLRDLLDEREEVLAAVGNGQGGGSKRGSRAARAAATMATEKGQDPKVAEVRLFGDFAKGSGAVHERVGGGEVVQDPYYGGRNGFEEVFQQVTRFSKGFLEYLEKGNE